MDKELFLEWMIIHRGKILGTTTGLLLGLSVIFLGVLKTLFIVICVILGYLAGKQLDDRIDIREKIIRLLSER